MRERERQRERERERERESGKEKEKEQEKEKEKENEIESEQESEKEKENQRWPNKDWNLVIVESSLNHRWTIVESLSIHRCASSTRLHQRRFGEGGIACPNKRKRFFSLRWAKQFKTMFRLKLVSFKCHILICVAVLYPDSCAWIGVDHDLTAACMQCQDLTAAYMQCFAFAAGGVPLSFSLFLSLQVEGNMLRLIEQKRYARGYFAQDISHPYNHVYILAFVHGLLEYARILGF